MSTLAERINAAWREFLKRRPDATLKELADACEVRPPSVSDWFSGETKSLKAAPAHKAAKFLGVSVSWLSDGVGPMAVSEPVPPEVESLISTIRRASAEGSLSPEAAQQIEGLINATTRKS